MFYGAFEDCQIIMTVEPNQDDYCDGNEVDEACDGALASTEDQTPVGGFKALFESRRSQQGVREILRRATQL
jgi:hypothetical protein